MRAILCCAVFFATTPASAEFLLLELSWHQPEPVTLPALYEVSSFDDTLPGAAWGEDVTAFDYVSWADQETVDSFNLDLTQVGATDQYSPLIGFSQGGQFPEGPEPGCATCWFSRLVANRADQAGTSEEWAIRVAAAALRAFGARTPAASQAAATGKGAQNPWGGFLSAFGETRDRREDAQNTVGGVLRIFDETREILIEAHK